MLAQELKEYPLFIGIQNFIAFFKTVLSQNKAHTLHLSSLRSILILSSYPGIGLTTLSF
jgi:hypothetical protein